jgi:hypothetical protein
MTQPDPDLRDRIAEALRPGSRDRSGRYPEGLMRDVDAVLAVLFGPIPVGTDVATWTAVRAIQLMNEAGRERDSLGREADRLRKDWVEMRERAEAGRSAALLEGAAALEALDPVEAALAGQHAWTDAGKVLRRLAGEAQQDEGPDDTIHACPGRWGGPDCRCFDDDQAAREAQQDPAPGGVRRCRRNDIVYGLCILPSGHEGDCAHEHQPRCAMPSPDGQYRCVLPPNHEGLHAEKHLAEVMPNGNRMVWETPAAVARPGQPLRGELKPWQLLADQPDEPLPQTERVVGGRRLTRSGQPETDEASPVCQGFVWIGQSFAICDRCAQPAWEHAGEEIPVGRGSLFGDVRTTVRAWEPGEADAIRAKWSR